jgi:hypothetical protein
MPQAVLAAVAHLFGLDILPIHLPAGTHGSQQPPPFVTPEAVLAAVAFLRDKKELPPSMSGRYPDIRGVSGAVFCLFFFSFLAVALATVLSCFWWRECC